MPRRNNIQNITPTLATVGTGPRVHSTYAGYSSDEHITISTKGSSPKSAMRNAGTTLRAARPKRRLKFAKYDEVFEIPHIKDLSMEEKEAVWMDGDEFLSIRRECLGAVGSVGNGKVVKDGHLLRGLDQHTNTYKATRDHISRQLYDAVLGVQEFQRVNGIDCSEVMSKVSQKYSESSVIAAHSAALSDLFSCFKGTWSQRSIPTIPTPEN